MLDIGRHDRSQIAFKDKVAGCCKLCFFRDLCDGSVPPLSTVPSCDPTKPAGKLTISIHLFAFPIGERGFPANLLEYICFVIKQPALKQG